MKFNQFVVSAKEALAIKPFHSNEVLSGEQQQQNARFLKFALVSAGLCLVAIEPSLAFAAEDTNNNVTKAIQAIVDSLTGKMGKGIATIAVIVLGLMAMFGKLAWDHAIKVIVGIAIVFGAATIVTWLGGGSNGIEAIV